MRQLQYELEINSIEDNHLEYDLRTIKTEVQANYKHGVPDGIWKLVCFDISPDVFSQSLIMEDLDVSDGSGMVEPQYPQTGNNVSDPVFTAWGISDNKPVSQPLLSAWLNKFSVITLTAYSAVPPIWEF